MRELSCEAKALEQAAGVRSCLLCRGFVAPHPLPHPRCPLPFTDGPQVPPQPTVRQEVEWKGPPL